MAEKDFKRKLAAILSADVEGYSRLMDDDEEATVRTLTAYRSAINDLVQQYRGRIVDTPGDNILAEFASVVDAVNCAVEIQRELAERNVEPPYNRKMEFRIGVNLGDVIEEEGRIYGDGVNIAARVESMAEAGGICISGRAYDQVANKLGLEYENLGEHQVKNITTPIRVYRVLSFPGAAAHRVVQAKGAVEKRWRMTTLGLVAILVLGAGGVLIWNFFLRPVPTPVEVTSEQAPALELPDRPSIAVLPFVNVSGDPEQEYFSDGITEQIITTISKIADLFVIARTSSFKYKGKAVNVQQVGRELGVRYVMEGSIQRTTDRIRISAQLIDTTTGHHLWAEHYDRDLKDIFALQDEITKKILTSLQVQLTQGEQARIWAKGTDNLEAYVKVLQGIEYFRLLNKEGNALTRQMMEEAIALDPKYPRAYWGLAYTHVFDILFGTSQDHGKSLEQADELVQKAFDLDPSLPMNHSLWGYIYLMKRQHEKAIAKCEKAIDLDPNGADNYAYLAMILTYVHRPEEAILYFKKALRLNPFPPSYYFHNLGRAYRMTAQYEEAIAELKKALHRSPNSLFALTELTATCILLGREEEARTTAARLLLSNPKFSLEGFPKKLPFKNQAEIEHLIDALRKAGLK